MTSGPGISEERIEIGEVLYLKTRTLGLAMADPSTFRPINIDVSFIPTVHRALRKESLSDDRLLVVSPILHDFCLVRKNGVGSQRLA